MGVGVASLVTAVSVNGRAGLSALSCSPPYRRGAAGCTSASCGATNVADERRWEAR